MEDINKTLKNAAKFNCITCEFTCSKQSDWDRHISRRKHLNGISRYNKTPKTPEPLETLETLETFTNVGLNESNEFVHMCKCSKTYKHSSGLWRHKKICKLNNDDDANDNINNTIVIGSSVDEVDCIQSDALTNNLIIEILKQNKTIILENQDFKEMIIEQNKYMLELASKAGTVTNNNTNTNNNHFNLNVFLNEKCKNAISLEDFVESLQINSQTAEYVGKHGFVNGITNIFMTGLRQLDVHMRPIHCTDAKRETMYVKGVDMWAKDGDTNTKMMSAIKDVSNKNMKQLPVWIEENPDSKISGTDKYEEQIQIMMGMLDVNTNKEKVLRNLAKEVLIDKTFQ